MATRSLIGINLNDGITKIIYCHWDGYPDHNGQLLVNHYNTPSAVFELMELGDLSSLGKTPAECDAYHRDKNQPWGSVEPRDVLTSELAAVGEDYGVDYVYVYNDEFEWECYALEGYTFDPSVVGLVPVNILADVA